MSDFEALERRVASLADEEAIRELKHRYMRCVDRNDLGGLRDIFTEDARSWYRDGQYGFEGREAIIEFLGQRERTPRSGRQLFPRLSLHTAHHPSITLTSSTTATGTWSMEDTWFTHEGKVLHGSGIYSDEYVKVEGKWKIRSTGYHRGFEHVEEVEGSLAKGPNAWAVPGSFPAERPRS